uniref:Uncharacterized protein n=1 Tax=Anopheles albimanus TaxID=7167 RepID=A0A182FXM7_ANOAL
MHDRSHSFGGPSLLSCPREERVLPVSPGTISDDTSTSLCLVCLKTLHALSDIVAVTNDCYTNGGYALFIASSLSLCLSLSLAL